MPFVERPDMSDYGVPDDLGGALPWSWAQERLVSNRNYWLVTASAAGRPHALPVWGTWLTDTDHFWFSCAPSARKARNLAENGRCVVTIDDTIECVSVEGWARIADSSDDAPAIDLAVASYVKKYWDDPTTHRENERFLRSNLIVEFVPERAFGIIEREDEFGPRATRWRWPAPASSP